MSSLGRIILQPECKAPRIIIAEQGKYLRGLEVVDYFREDTCFKLSTDDITKVNYRGKRLDNCSISLEKSFGINRLNIREIGLLSEDSYYKLLKCFVNYQTVKGANSSSYLLVREEVHQQLIKRMNIHGV